MAKPGEYADLLRLIGALLDEQSAQAVEIIDHGSYIAVSWQRPGSGPDQRTYSELDLEELRARARGLRGDGGDQARGAWAELLRTLGQELDTQKLEITGVVED